MAEALGIAGSAVGIVSLGLQIAQGLLQYYGSWKDQDNDIADMCLSLENLSASLEILRETLQPPAKFNQAVRDNVEKSVNAVDGTLQKLHDELSKVRETALPTPGVRSAMRRHVRRALYPFREETLNKIQGAVAEARQNLDLALQILQVQSVVEVRRDVHNLVRWQEATETLAILDWLSPKNFWLRQTDLSNQRQPGTGQWLLQNPDFLDWANGGRETIWCRGGPGVGKTILASAVVEFLDTDLPTHDAALTFVYCDHKQNQAQDVSYFVGAIVRQLAERKSEVPGIVSSLYRTHRGKGTSPTLAEYQDLLRSLGKEYMEVYIVIDALDECIDAESQSVWHDFVAILQSTLSSLRLLYTSRDIHDTTEVFQSSTTIPICASEADITTYVEGQLASRNVLRQFCMEDPTLQSEILQSVVARSEGMFLAARLHLESLTSKTNRRAVRKSLQKLPTTLSGSYDDAMERIKKQPTEALALRVLAWTVNAVRPLQIEELQHAVAVNELESDDEDIPEDIPEDILTPPGILINACAGLVNIDEASNVIGLVHKTTQEYFDQTGCIHFPRAEKDLTSACIQYLSLPVLGAGPCPSKKEYKQRLVALPLLQYASRNLGQHARKTDSLGEHEGLVELLTDQDKLSSTVQALFVERRNGHDKFPQNFVGTHLAAYFGLGHVLRLLIENRCGDPHNKDSWGRTPLAWAVMQGHIQDVKFLLEKGADFNVKDKYGHTPLSLGAQHGRKAAVSLLLRKGADFELGSQHGRTPLMRAAGQGHQAIVELLLEKGADIHVKDKHGWTSLSHAACRNRNAIVRLLLEKGANTDPEEKLGWNALHLMAANGDLALEKLLREKGVSPLLNVMV